jgi:hypothetical protein
LQLVAVEIANESFVCSLRWFWTFSIPKAICGIMLRDRRLLKLIPKCAFEAVKLAMKEAVARGVAECGGTPGAILAIHTAGNLLQWNPHVHGIVTEGFFDRDGMFVHLPDLHAKFGDLHAKFGDLHAKSVELLFGELLLKELLKKERISPGLVSSMAAWRHSGFSTHSKPAPSDPADPAFFHMLRHMKRPTVAISRIALDPDRGKVVYTADFNPMLGTDRIEVDLLEFTAKVLIHVPDKNSRRVIGYGAYSNRALGERRKKARGGEESAGVGAKVSTYEPMRSAPKGTPVCMQFVPKAQTAKRPAGVAVLGATDPESLGNLSDDKFGLAGIFCGKESIGLSEPIPLCVLIPLHPRSSPDSGRFQYPECPWGIGEERYRALLG